MTTCIILPVVKYVWCIRLYYIQSFAGDLRLTCGRTIIIVGCGNSSRVTTTTTTAAAYSVQRTLMYNVERSLHQRRRRAYPDVADFLPKNDVYLTREGTPQIILYNFSTPFSPSRGIGRPVSHLCFASRELHSLTHSLADNNDDNIFCSLYHDLIYYII